MKKLLFALLIAFVVSAVVQTEDKELKGFDITKFIASLAGELKKLYKLLKSRGYWDKILSAALSGRSVAAISLCTGYTGQDSLCSQLVGRIAA